MVQIAHLTRHARWAGSFRFRDFRLLWVSTLVQSLGMGMEQMSLGWMVLEITDSPFMVGLSAAARMAPFFFLGILSGVVADRVDRRVALRVITVAAVVVAGLMALLLLTDDLSDVPVWYVIGLGTAMGGVWAFSQTVRHAYTYDIVGPALALNGLSLAGLGQKFGHVGGAILAGTLISRVGVGAQYLVVAGSYLAALAVLLAIHRAGRSALSQRESVVRQLLEYLQLLRGNHTLLVLMCLTGVVEIFGFTHQTLLPVFAKVDLDVGPLGLGVMTGLRQAGGVIGLIFLATLGDFRRKGLLMFASSIAFGLGLMAFSLAGSIVLFVIVLTFVNASASTVDTLNKTLIQASVPDEQRGRAMGSWVLSIGVAPIGHTGLGAIAGALGAPGALLVNGGILTLISVSAAVGLPRIRRLE